MSGYIVFKTVGDHVYFLGRDVQWHPNVPQNVVWVHDIQLLLDGGDWTVGEDIKVCAATYDEVTHAISLMGDFVDYLGFVRSHGVREAATA